MLLKMAAMSTIAPVAPTVGLATVGGTTERGSLMPPARFLLVGSMGALAVVGDPVACHAQWAAVPLQPTANALSSRVSAVTPGFAYGRADIGAIAPLCWSLPSAAWTNIAPTAPSGEVDGARSDQLVGQLVAHAVLWQGPSRTLMDLNPAGWDRSQALATSGEWQAGFVYTALPGTDQAAVWHGSAGSFTLLHPAGALESQATAADGVYQGGWVHLSAGVTHAAVWAGTAQSMIDLNPPGASGSDISGMFGGQIVGEVSYGIGSRAAMWPSLTSPFIDLTPPGITYATLSATCGSAQVGYLSSNQFPGAAIWFGTAASYTPLGPYLPAGYQNSIATSVAFDGHEYIVGGYAENISTGNFQAMVWIGVPAPTSLTVLVAGGVALGVRRRGAVSRPDRRPR
jgi:hypothetical protein